MRLLRGISRWLLGFTLIISGFLKVISPVGTSLVLQEYLKAFHLEILLPASLLFGSILSILELVLGFAILQKLATRAISKITLTLISTFTILTLILALSDIVEDCGCFGEAINLTNWETFYKNLILLICAFIVFHQRHKVQSFKRAYADWVYLCSFATIVIGFNTYCYFIGPPIEFTPFKVGSDLTLIKEPEYETTFIYEKDGESATFTIDNLPDSTWTYKDAVTTSVGAAFDANFAIFDSNGTEITDSILSLERVFITTIYNSDKLTEKRWARIHKLRYEVNSKGGVFLLATDANGINGEPSAVIMDHKTLITINRSNGGTILLTSGMLCEKWTNLTTPNSEEDISSIIQEDEDMIMVKKSIKKRITGESSIVALILLLILMAYIRTFSIKSHKNNIQTNNSKDEVKNNISSDSSLNSDWMQ
jgi:triosephosphate isomerase